jgi:hypothetical protein
MQIQNETDGISLIDALRTRMRASRNLTAALRIWYSLALRRINARSASVLFLKIWTVLRRLCIAESPSVSTGDAWSRFTAGSGAILNRRRQQAALVFRLLASEAAVTLLRHFALATRQWHPCLMKSRADGVG